MIRNFLAVALIISPVLCMAEELNMRPGLWDDCGAYEGVHINCVMKCVAAEDLKGDQIIFAGQKQKEDKECSLVYYKKTGDTIEWKADCCKSTKAPNTSEGKITYKDTSYKGEVIGKLGCNDKSVAMPIMHLEGHYLGPTCSK